MKRRHLRTMMFACVAALAAAPASAQRETIYPYHAPVGDTPDLSFPAEPVSFNREKATLLFKPDGAGPFRAIVLMPTCGGHNFSYHVFDWAEKAIKRGYVALVVDPLNPRGVSADNCRPPLKVPNSRLIKDAFDAAEHLRKLPFVDGEQIALMGFSQGAMVALGASGAEHSGKVGRRPFRAAISFYPACVFYDVKLPSRETRVDLRYLTRKITTPLLVLMGEDDTETDPKDCVPLLAEQKGQDAPVEWEVYKGTTHAFDDIKWKFQTFRKKDFRGTEVVYRYNEESVREAEKRAFAFLERHFAK